MYHVSAQDVDERMINGHYYYYYNIEDAREVTHVILMLLEE